LAFLDLCVILHTDMRMRPQGPRAAELRKLKHDHLRILEIPPDALPGSLAQCFRKCGKANCHCASGPGHPVWLLTYMVNGKKRVERIPEAWVEDVRRQVGLGKAFREKLTEILNANAELLVLWRRQQQQ
jgi:hypothetical protein